jgi:poly-gamma-glutamate capsule biosynthesis protein CapA/YwtB (metallophosphatase superfamily)
MATILIGGDICPAGAIQRDFIEGDGDAILHDLQADVAGADLAIANLECPLVSADSPIVKAGPVLGAPASCIRGFVAMHWQVLNLANNHSFDHGSRGLRDTIGTIRQAGLDYVGAGENIAHARAPLVREIEGERIVVYAMADHEFSAADEDTPGANPLDLVECVHAIRQHKREGLFIVLIHGGNEYYPYPSPEMVKRCRFIVEMGADAVICCHAHCALPWEVYAGRPIVYGMGNLVFEAETGEPDAWYEGYLAKLTVEHARVHFEPIPYVQGRGPGARRMDREQQTRFLADMEQKSRELQDGAFLRTRWTEHCRRKQDTYLAMLFGYSRLMHRLRRPLLRVWPSEAAVRQALLLVQCEAHREVLNTIFNEARPRA